MKKLLLLLISQCWAAALFAQTTVFDRSHLEIVVENGVMRQAAELTAQNYLSSINDRLSDIKINLGSVILTEQLIYSSLTQIDQGLKSAIAVREIAQLVSEITDEATQMISFASDHPHLLLFAEDVSTQMRGRGARLAGELAQIVLAERGDLLLNFEKRDAILKKISLELRIIRALVFSMRKCMYWAGQRSLFSALNPYKGFINIDKQLVQKIINNYKTLKR